MAGPWSSCTVIDAGGSPVEAAAIGAEAAIVDLGFVGHATVRLEVGGTRILTDPFLRAGLGPLERHGPVPDPDALGDVDLVLISHGHPDHLDRASLAALGGAPVVAVPRGLGRTVRRWTRGDVVEMAVGERLRVGAVAIEAVPARHWVTPGSVRAAPQGYVIDSGLRTWFAGDTGPLPPDLRPPGPIDVALLPVWTWGPHLGPGHLGPRSAAELLAEIEARVAVPIHWGTLYPRRLHRVWSRPLTEPGDRFAMHVERLAPQADVRLLHPGDATTIHLAPAAPGQAG
jgi:L-ascorbate metabolism protein UlaG (beta-lactamase superfamily)